MHRFYIPPEKWNADPLVLDDTETHHARHVLRLAAGDRVTVFNGRGAEATAEIVSLDETARLRRVLESKTQPLACRITLAQAVPKGKNMEFIIQKATELGAAAIAPLISERTVVRIDADDIRKKHAKWQETVIEAAKQCGQNWLPEVQLPRTPREFFDARQRFDLMLIASLQPDAIHFKKVLAEMGEAAPREVLILVGPEGDFTPAEINLAKSHGCRPITLGPIVLRTETAAIYCLSVLSYELLAPRP